MIDFISEGRISLDVHDSSILRLSGNAMGIIFRKIE
tara:strand:+ start:131351 stop:131458 length:108 start_codon:yes stop_codon:yes gene_type:complete